MERFKLNYLIYLIVGLGIIVLVIAAYKAEKKYEKNLMLVVNKEIKEAAEKCYLKNECQDQIKLEDLYNKEYLEEMVNPVTKEIMDINMCLEYIEGKVEFCK